MGVSGSGKSVVGAALAQRIGVPFEDGDDLHPSANIDKMMAGHPLDDEDRRPWLIAIGAWLADHAEGGGLVSCSALKRSYRDLIRSEAPDVVFVHLSGDREVIRRRQATRPGHFMPASLMDSQFDTLEPLAPDERGFVVDIGARIDDVVARAAEGLDGVA
ncbi:MAG: gluconokinase [Marmoricola sp.]